MRISGTRSNGRGRRWYGGRPARTAAAATLVALVGLAGCTGSGGRGGHDDAGPTVTVSGPASGAKDVPTSTTVSVKAGRGGKVTAVSLTGPGGKAVAGQFLPGDPTSWLPGAQLDYGTTYQVAVTAKNPAGKQATTRSSFSTMARPDADHLVRVSSYVGDNMVYGVAMPVVVNFGSPDAPRSVPDSARAAIQQRMFVASTPSVVGAWHWWSDHEVHFRPKESQ